jgi:CDGSH-type Zn-finger protein
MQTLTPPAGATTNLAIGTPATESVDWCGASNISPNRDGTCVRCGFKGTPNARGNLGRHRDRRPVESRLTEDERAEIVAHFLYGSDGAVLVRKVEAMIGARLAGERESGSTDA